MNRFTIATAGLALGFTCVLTANAFLDDLAELREELALYQTTHAADLGGVVEKLEDISGPSFDDVSEADWYYPFVSSAAAWKIVSGYKNAQGDPTGKFGPQNNVTIAEALKMIFKATKTDEQNCLRPPQHPKAKGHWAERYVSCAEELQMRLFQTSSFQDLNRPAQRAEVIALINDAFRDTVPPLYASFSDTKGHVFESDIGYAIALGIVTGDKDAEGNLLGTFRPNEPINRAEVSKILYARLRAQVKSEMTL